MHQRHARYAPHTVVQILLLGLFIALALATRLYHLGTLPAGLHHDEASNGMLALDILTGKAYPVFFSTYTGKEAGYMYFVALAIALVGQTTLAIRLPAALAGVLLVPVVFLLGRRATTPWGGVLAAGITAIAPWLLHMNRIGFRANLLPLCLALWVWLLLRGLDDAHTHKQLNWIAAGGMLGLTAYTYTASRIVPLLLVLFVLYLALAHRAILRRCWQGMTIMVSVAGMTALPLLVHYWRVPSDWSERLHQIGVCAELTGRSCTAKILGNGWATIGMVALRGDPMGFFNLPNAPALPLAIGWLFFVGLGIALWRIREPAIALVVLWWGVMVIPGILSQDSPHFLRTLGAAPPTIILCILPLVPSSRKEKLNKNLCVFASLRLCVAVRNLACYCKSTLENLLPVLGMLLIAIAGASSIHDYFVVWANRPALYYEYMGYATDAARAIDRLHRQAPHQDIYISEEYYRHPTYTYLTPSTAYAHWFDARWGLPLPQVDKRSLFVISPATPTDARVSPFVQGAVGENVLNEQGQYAYTLLRLDVPSDHEQATQPTPTMVYTMGSVRFTGITLVPPNTASNTPSNLHVTLYWEVHQPESRELRVFLHLVDTDGKMVAQHDVMSYPAREWQVGDRFVTFHTLPIPTGWQQLAHPMLLKLGLYDETTGERLPPTPVGDGQHGGQVVVQDGAVVIPLP